MRALYVGVAGALAAAASASAATIRATTTQDQFGAGAACALREAAQAAADDAAFGGCRSGNGSDVVVLRGGKTYRLNRAATTPPTLGNGAVGLLADITLKAQGQGRATVDGSGLDDRLFSAAFANNRIIGLVLRDGRDSISGGGAVGVGGASELVIKNSVLRDNRSTSTGGAIANFGSLRIDRSTLAENRAQQSGGAIYSHVSTTITVKRSTLWRNRARGTVSHGGAIMALDQLDLVNSTISRNFTDGSGGGLWVDSGSATVNNSTIAANIADAEMAFGGDGGGVGTVDGGSISARNSIIGANADLSGEADDCASTMLALSYSLLGDSAGCAGFFPSADNVIGANPKLKPLGANGGPTKTHALKATSQARNAASPSAPGSGGVACEPRDQRGVQRPKGPRCDMGAWEGN